MMEMINQYGPVTQMEKENNHLLWDAKMMEMWWSMTEMINQPGLVILAKTYLLGNQEITIFSVKEKSHIMDLSDQIMEKLMSECRKMVILWFTLIKTNHYGQVTPWTKDLLEIINYMSKMMEMLSFMILIKNQLGPVTLMDKDKCPID